MPIRDAAKICSAPLVVADFMSGILSEIKKELRYLDVAAIESTGLPLPALPERDAPLTMLLSFRAPALPYPRPHQHRVGLANQQVLSQNDFVSEGKGRGFLYRHIRENTDRIDENGHRDEKMRLIGRIAAEFMWHYSKVPVTPHHTQTMAMLMFSQFYDLRYETSSLNWHNEFNSLILQVKTGEGKSIVIAMLSIFIVLYYKKRVHVLTNNEGLLSRDFKEFKPFCALFTKANGFDQDITCSDKLDSSKICFTLKQGINRLFYTNILLGNADLKGTILLVDEVDDLVVNEEPTSAYTKVDCEKSNAIKPALPAASALSTMGPTVAGDGTTTTITTTTSTATATTDTGASATVDATIGDDTGATSLESAEQVATAIGDGGHLTTTTNITIVTTTTTTTTSTALVSSATPNAAAAAAAAATAAAAEAAVAATAASVVGVDSAPSSRRHPYVVVLVHGLWSFVLFLVNLARDPPPPSSQPCHGHRLRVHGNGT